MLEVYKITNKTNEKIYIGITNQGYKTRWYKHCSESASGSNTHFHNAIRKYGKENFLLEVVEEIPITETGEETDFDFLKEREKYWIKYFNSYDRNIGYNLTLGGDGTFGRWLTESTKDKIRKSRLGKKASVETRNKMSESQKNRKRDSELQREISIKANKARWEDPEQHRKVKEENAANKIIFQYDKKGKFLKEYYSVSEASRQLCGDERYGKNIGACARRKIPSAYGYKWEYKDTLIKELDGFLNKEMRENPTFTVPKENNFPGTNASPFELNLKENWHRPIFNN